MWSSELLSSDAIASSVRLAASFAILSTFYTPLMSFIHVLLAVG